MSTIESVPLSSEELVRRAVELQPLLARNAGQAEADRRLSEENVQAIKEAGLLSLGVPRRFGGQETTIRTQLEVSSTLAEACGSTGWVVQNINGACVMGGLYADRAQREVWESDPGALLCGTMAPVRDVVRVDGGWRISGRWGYVSGIYHAQWAYVGFPLVDEQGVQVDLGVGLVPISDGVVEDTWFVAGMRGTGSNTLVLDDVFVPEHRVLRTMPAIEGEVPTEHTDEALYRTSQGAVQFLVLVGAQLGLGRGALKLVREAAPRRPVSYTSRKQAESTGFQIQLADAALRIDAAHLHAYRAADEIDAAAANGEHLPYERRAHIRAECGWICDLLRGAVDTLVNAHGAGSFAEPNPLQRIWRDLGVGSRHAGMTSQLGYEIHGKALLGRDERPMLVL
ncbi:acyl-CoA dehydrogenase family protein [Conexibacter woesei]|uniref:Acyl-CoA dehydrogenase type 2 domain protein n=1 Tax=Conexibacter woesei (strain DSM 14684 / CCUG 47730 / CIP 108061 / JCM 11494 / NBRC 100937 / ID131577) TaxID=469383 RepID=D3F591_CONWI|nr:acyl-CoA dehydrogenase family protein [Conexibacter woesei]ADB50558.1 Acyl-CoA dehydrogenase type 2 domain protein [Conexibacter woesei DSM 14684]